MDEIDIDDDSFPINKPENIPEISFGSITDSKKRLTEDVVKVQTYFHRNRFSFNFCIFLKNNNPHEKEYKENLQLLSLFCILRLKNFLKNI